MKKQHIEIDKIGSSAAVAVTTTNYPGYHVSLAVAGSSTSPLPSSLAAEVVVVVVAAVVAATLVFLLEIRHTPLLYLLQV